MFRVAIIEGDGIGPEVTSAALKVLNRVASKYNLNLDIIKVEAGDGAYRKYGSPLPEDSWRKIVNSDVILKAPVGETAGDVVVKIRRELDLYANIRPSRAYPNVPCLRPSTDLVIVRENTEDVYVRAEHMLPNDVAIALRVISKKASERIARIAFKLAMERKRKVTIVHKANVMTISDGLFRSTVREVSKEFPEVQVNEMYVDAAVMDLVRRPEHFDVIVTTNLFGDILSDLAAYITGSIGLAPSANIGDEKAMFEPIHGAAFDIAGKGIANPTAMILCTAWMLKWLGTKHELENYVNAALAIERAIEETLSEASKLTPDLGGSTKTEEFTQEVLKRV
ncbi:MAG: 3-isopropylmalate dehydrogenase [Thermoprotei archaeon ex4572_64]|nr:MAG: 3-isopropylmalate dehydrogenase [Thermoprotei archaeon ex4572_64]